LDEPSEGTIVVEGKDAKSLKGNQLNKFRNEKFGFVFQQFFMNANDSVLNNVLLPLKIAKLSGRRRKKLARHALESVDLTDKVKSIANELSGGQKQRVCIARAIVNKPEIIFADEPTGNLDSETSELIEKLLFGIREKQSSTLIIVTHDKELAEKCDRRIVIKDGRIV
jgi:putative ABC transport system ATP-binding protein